MQEYTSESIQVLEGLEGVRRRPSMYSGDINVRGLHQLIFEVIDNSVDEALAGYCKEIKVILHQDNSATVIDDGRGIPVELHPVYKKPAIELVFTKLHAGGKFDNRLYKVAGGLHGVGISVVNALSEYLHVEVKRGGKRYLQSYAYGKVTKELEVVGEAEGTGTSVRFKPDGSIFEVTQFSFEIIAHRLRELAFLVKGLRIELEDQRSGRSVQFCFEGGLAEFVSYLNQNKTVLHPPFYFKTTQNNVEVEFALQYNDGYLETLLSYANTINTRDGGTHLIGFKTALTRALNDYNKRIKLIKDRKFTSLSGEDIREGLCGVISVNLPQPQFEGQTKSKLGNSEIKPLVESVVYEAFSNYLDAQPKVAKAILTKAYTAARAREAAKQARELVRKRSLLEGSTLPGKLADCSWRNPIDCELYLVEGESAGGSAKLSRDRRFQAILPLRGKILNTEKAPLDKILSNEEIKAIVAALGCGIGADGVDKGFDINKLRYSKVIIMTDADVDGAHIRTLLLTFLYRYMKPLIEEGHVYIAQPPLYSIKKNNKEYYAYSEAEYRKILNQIGEDKVVVQRYKGLGEMNPQQLWSTTMNPENRILLRVTPQDALEADHLFTLFMGEKVEPRRKFIQDHAKQVRNLDI